MTEEVSSTWSDFLESWAIPEEILAQAPTSPWIHPPMLFEVPEKIADTPSHRVARERLAPTDSILDVGCGGGIAAFAIAGSTNNVVGVDHQSEMTEMFRKNAQSRNLQTQVFTGFWDDIQSTVPVADIVVCHHVVYNIANIQEFIASLSRHARKRVVIEMPTEHPLSNMRHLWKYFWNLDRPHRPHHLDFVEEVRRAGFAPHVEVWQENQPRPFNLESNIEFMRIRLCLDESRDSEIAEQLKLEVVKPRQLATIWWNLN